MVLAILGKILDWWTRHASMLALPILIAFVSASYFDLGFDAALFCSEEEACAREWVSALSGYFALGAAALTVVEMTKQRRLQNEIQRENVELQIGRQIVLAKSVVHRLRHVDSLLALVNQNGMFGIDGKEWLGDFRTESLFGVFRTIDSMLKESQFLDFELYAGSPIAHQGIIGNIEEAVRRYEEYIAKLNDLKTDPIAYFDQVGPAIKDLALLVVSQCVAYSSAAQSRAHTFISRWEDRITPKPKCAKPQI